MYLFIVGQVQLSAFSPHHSPTTEAIPTSHPSSYLPHWLCPCILYTCSLMALSNFFPITPSHFPSHYCQFVLYFNVSGYILFACLFFWLGSLWFTYSCPNISCIAHPCTPITHSLNSVLIWLSIKMSSSYMFFCWDTSGKIMQHGTYDILLPMFSSKTFIVSQLIFKIFVILSLFCVWCKMVIEFHIFAGTCPDLPVIFLLKRLFLLNFMLLPTFSNSNWP